MKVGDKVWVNLNGKPQEVVIDFLGNQEIAFRANGEIKSRCNNEVYASKKEAETIIYANKMVAFCREVNRTTGEVAVYKIDAEVTDHLIQYLSIRSRFNPELRYGVTMVPSFEKYRNDMEDIDVMEQLADEYEIVLL